MIADGVDPMWTLAALPLIVAAMIVLTTATSMLLAALYVRVRDVANIWAVLSLVLFYATPILYPIEYALDNAPDGFREVILINPLTPDLRAGPRVDHRPERPRRGRSRAGDRLLVLIPALLSSSASARLSVWVFNREAPRIAEAL